MLRTYVLHPEFYDGRPLVGGDLINFADLIQSLDRHVTLVVPDPEMEAFTGLVNSSRLGVRAELAMERVLRELAESGSAIVRHMPTNEKTPVERATQAAVAHHADALIVRSRSDIPVKTGGIAWRVLEDVVREILGDADSIALDKLPTEAAIDDLLARFFRRDDVLVVVDPFLGANILRGSRAGDFLEGLTKILQVWSKARPGRHPRPRVEFVMARSKTRASDRGQVPQPSGDPDFVAIRDELSRRVQAECNSLRSGVAEPWVEVKVGKSFTDRGLHSSRRDWEIAHNLDELGKWLRHVRARSHHPAPAPPSVQLLQRAEAHRLSFLRDNAQRCGSPS